MKFKLEIELGNDAMQSYEDIIGALEKTAGKLRETARFHAPAKGDTAKVMDQNGLSVGKWCITR